jgi:hypothetical protein
MGIRWSNNNVVHNSSNNNSSSSRLLSFQMEITHQMVDQTVELPEREGVGLEVEGKEKR